MNILNLYTYLIFFGLIQLRCQAQPVQKTTIRRISSIEDVRVSTGLQSFDDSSSFRVNFKLSSDVRRIRLDLHPSRTAVNHVTNVVNAGQSGPDDLQDRLEMSAPLLDEDALSYQGEALIFDPKCRSWRKAGDGRIVVGPFGPSLFEGVFSLDGDVYCVLLSFNYRKLRRPEDPSLPLLGSTHMVAWRKTDVV
ncbi:zinc metalloprotease mde10 [Fusarium sporotrichioides]|uniref:Zinc metalloprotease mde10 n=1 Tax=Fusarium sporotrichioides TaxID=5514 RepID=A0A395RMU0_FUSSP|nr:zinc metalloprotease mde10 [Fusarium sporotrichioides]